MVESSAAAKARALWEEGLSVIPLGSPGEEPPAWFVRDRCGGDLVDAREKWPKTPRIKWSAYQKRQATAAELDAWIRNWPTCNWGVTTGWRIVAIDADSQEAAAFMESGRVTRTPRKVITAKGAHYWYQVDDKLPFGNSANPNAKLDKRGTGGYVVAPESIHATGVIYTEEILPGWGDVSWPELPKLSAADLDAVNGFNGLEIGTDGATRRGNLNFDATTVAPAGEDLSAPIVGSGRNTATNRYVGKLIQDGLSLREIKALADQFNGQHVDEAGRPSPLSESELNTTIASTIRTHLKNNPGAAVPVVEPPPHVPARLGAFNAGDFEGVAPKPIVWLWDQWIGRRMTAGIFAEGGTGKSMFMLQMAVCMATGRPFIDGSTLAHGRSLLVFCEDEMDRVNERLVLILSHMGLSFADVRDDIFILARIGEDSTLMKFDRAGNGVLTPFWHDLEAEIIALQPALVLIDTATDTFAGNPLDNQQVRFFIQTAFTSLAINHDLALCFLSHVSASGKASGSGTAGALAWRDRARVQIYMHRESPEDPAIHIKRMKANYAQNGVEFTAYSNAGYLQGQARIDLSDQVYDIARMDFMALMERFQHQGSPVSPARNSPHFAPKVMARYSQSNPKSIKTKDPSKYETALNQLLEEGRIIIVTDQRKGTKTLEIAK